MKLSNDLLRRLEREHGGAFYVLDTDQFARNFKELEEAFRCHYPASYIAYSYKTNYTPRLCKLVDDLGGYAEVVSDMEYEIARRLGIATSKVHFNGPYKNQQAICEIVLGGGVVNLDDYVEVPVILELARQHPKQTLNIGLRCNFLINDGVTSRFGFDVTKPDFSQLIARLNSVGNIRIAGLHCHFAARALPTWQPRAEGLCRLASQFAEQTDLDHLDLGGGLFGKMKDSLKAQFDSPIPTYQEYAREAAACVAAHFAESQAKPKLFIEPGSALVGDAMKFVSRVESIKDVRGKAIATMLGSIYNINPTLNTKNPPLTVYAATGSKRQDYTDLDLAGFTCIERDYLYRGYSGPLGVGDLVVFDNVGSYSVVLKPPFILPNFPVIELTDDGTIRVVKRQETFDDLFHTYSFDF